MAAYAKIQKFMTLVNAANPTFEKWKKSSLRPLINILNNVNGTPQQVQNALAGLAPAKANKYKKALYYLLTTYPGLAPFAASINFAPLGKLDAALYTQTQAPQGYNPGAPAFNRIVAPSAFLNMTVEQVVLTNQNAGVILIHVSSHDAGMDLVFNGDTCLDHIESVLRVARKTGRDVCVLYMEEPPVLQELQKEVNGIANKVMVLEKRQHMGIRQQALQTFVQKHNPLVVMGFDALICVEANIFGAPDYMDNGSLAPPLVTLKNVVTSRAVLVTTGTLFPKKDSGQWGCLYNT